MSRHAHLTPDEFKTIRLELGYTHDDMAEILDLTRRQVIRLENGTTKIGKPAAILIQLIFLYRNDREDDAVELIGRVIYGDGV
jgi:DNA-binding XRE family transcriptional regulator